MPSVSFTELQVGQEYSRQQLAAIWQYRAYQAIARGVVTPAGHASIILFVTREKQDSAQKYEDRLEGNRLYWEGPTDHFAEERILNVHNSGDEIHLFYRDRHHSNFRYHGQLRLLDAILRVASPSAFVFALVSGASTSTVPGVNSGKQSIGIPRLRERSLDELRRLAFSQESAAQDASVRKVKSYSRSKAIKDYVLLRAAGRCEGCGEPAPFLKPTGSPYLEPHHVQRRSDNGLDHPLWVIALCPNCHARVHHGADGHDYNSQLAARIAALESSSL